MIQKLEMMPPILSTRLIALCLTLQSRVLIVYKAAATNPLKSPVEMQTLRIDPIKTFLLC